MAIYKRGSVWWMDVYVGADRRRVRKSTGCTDEVQARIVEQSAVAVNRGLTSRQRALAIVDAILPEEDRGLPVAGIGAFYDACSKDDGTQPSLPEQRKRLCVVGRLAVWLKDHSRVKWASEISAEVAYEYAKTFAGRGVTAKTRNNEVGQLHSVWQVLIRHGKASDNPWSLMRAKRNRVEEKHGRAFTDDEVERILVECKKAGFEWYEVTMVALYTGLRMRDVELMRAGDVDLARNVITLDPSKTKNIGVKVRSPIHKKLREVLEGIVAGKGADEYLFPYRAAHPSANKERHGDIKFAEILRRAGIAEGEGEKLSFHSLRHTFISRLAEAGVAQDVRMKLAGHTRADTHEIYDHQMKPLVEAIARLS